MRWLRRNRKSYIVRIMAVLVVAACVPPTIFAVSDSVPAIASAVDGAVSFAERNGILPETTLSAGCGEPLLYQTTAPIVTTAITTAQLAITFTTTKPVEVSDEPVVLDVISRNISQENEDLSAYSSRDCVITKTTFTSNAGTDYITLYQGGQARGQVRNCTDITTEDISAESELPPDISLKLDGKPEVLIMHTHTTESYSPSESTFDNSYTSRTLDAGKSVVAVGDKIAEQLAAAGIGVIHDGTVHDSPEYNGSYSRSAETVKALLSEYPSIKVVLDIHRDAISELGSPVAAVTQIDGREAAQVMIISAADDGTYNIPDYMQNFRLACALQRKMEHDNPTITRPVLFQYCQYNQELSTGSLLIEVGSHGNTLEQALYSGELIGKSIASALLSMKE